MRIIPTVSRSRVETQIRAGVNVCILCPSHDVSSAGWQWVRENWGHEATEIGKYVFKLRVQTPERGAYISVLTIKNPGDIVKMEGMSAFFLVHERLPIYDSSLSHIKNLILHRNEVYGRSKPGTT